MNVKENKNEIVKKIKVKFSNWYEGFSISDLGPIIYHNKYLIESGIEIEESDDPDFVFYNVFGDFLYNSSVEKTNVVKILFITEPVSPDFMFFDYCIGFEPYDYGGRNIYYPFFVSSCFSDSVIPTNITYNQAIDILRQKSIFCEMIYGHDGRDISRKKYFDLLSSYKKVESAGTYLNNQENNISVDYRNSEKSKFYFQRKCKFSLCIQSIKKEWFINEKIVHALYAYEIPIFYGCDEIKRIFNPKRFIFIEDFPNDEALLERIVEIDNNDDLFCNIISQPIFNDNNFFFDTVDKAAKKMFDILISKEKRLIERNREKYIKNTIIKNKEAYFEINQRQCSKFRTFLSKIKRFIKNV